MATIQASLRSSALGFGIGHSTLTKSQTTSRTFPSALRPCLPSLVRKTKPVAQGITCSGGPNLFFELVGSALAGGVVTAVTLATNEERDKAIDVLQTPEGVLPFAAAAGADLVAHSIPLLNVLLNLISEPTGAACGVAYLMSIVLSSPSVDPNTMAPAGTVLNAKKVADIRGSVRVPFTKIIPTVLKVVDTSNEFSTGKGWTTGKDGLPKLPITSVAAVIGIGAVILEVLGHAPVLGLFLPRVFQVAGWLAVVGYLLEKREAESSGTL